MELLDISFLNILYAQCLSNQIIPGKRLVAWVHLSVSNFSRRIFINNQYTKHYVGSGRGPEKAFPMRTGNDWIQKEGYGRRGTLHTQVGE